MQKITIIALLIAIIICAIGEVYILREFENIYAKTAGEIKQLQGKVQKIENNNCPLKFNDVCYPISSITSISCGESAGKSGLYECEVLFKSNIIKE